MAEVVRAAARAVRCAIYTRKSSEEGLEQEFNSLDAQREAAEAFIGSQRGQGWLALPHLYNDGGWSGATLDRPALRRLLADIEARRVDSVVVYKVDRLSRSLLDFARLMSLFEQHGVTFVSVTQQFNTSTPVGRLTLHILLSFAEFERALISERTRDKKAAAKRKGKWTGGYLPLGYDLDAQGGKLLVNSEEAKQVRTIFEQFAATGSLELTLEEIHRRGWKTKSWVTTNERRHEGGEFRESTLRRLLANECYAGTVNYRGQSYHGEQPRIIEPRLWRRVQRLLLAADRESRRQVRNKHGALLYGLLRCSRCSKPMAHTSTGTGNRRYRYYVCRSKECSRRCVNAGALEASVVEHLANLDPRGDDVPGRLAALVEAVLYDAQQDQVSIRLRTPQERRRG